jgi:L-cysteine S-thiosulfotransferase
METDKGITGGNRMRQARNLAFATAAALAVGAAQAAEIAPDDVAFEDGAVQTSLTGTPGDPAEGRKVYAGRALGNCVACHAITDMTDVPWHGEVGPVLDGVGDRWSEAELRGIVSNAKIMFPDSIMPSFYKVTGFIRPGDAFTGKAATEIKPLLAAQQIEDVVAFLMTLK